MGRPRLHDERTERELLAAAQAILATEGVAGLSVRRLADAAGTTPRAIYSVFGGMDGLLQALFREGFEALSADLDALPLTDDPEADLLAMGVQGFRGWARAHPELFRLVFGERPAAVGPDRIESGEAAFERLLAKVRRCIDAGRFPQGSEAEIGLAFHALCEGLADLEARGRFPPLAGRDSESLWARALGALVRGYRR